MEDFCKSMDGLFWFSLEFLKAAGALVTATGVVLAFIQLRRTVRWNKLNATFTLFSNETLIQRETAAAEALLKKAINLYSVDAAITHAQAVEIYSDPAAYSAVKNLLNFFEDYSAAVHTGLLLEDTAYDLMGDLLTRYHRVFHPLITHVREQSNPTIWVEIEKLDSEWLPRLQREEEKLKQQHAAERERKTKANRDIGARKKYD